MQRPSALETDFKALFAREYDKLCRYALSYMQDEHLAEDIVQDTFIKFWEQKKDLINTENARFYLITAVRNNCISALRKDQRKQVVLTENTPETEPEPFFSSRQHAEAENEQMRRITDALNQLPPKCKEVFLLIKLHGMSYKQAAESLDISVKTVENQMGKAIKIFRDYTSVQAVLLMILLMVKKYFLA